MLQYKILLFFSVLISSSFQTVKGQEDSLSSNSVAAFADKIIDFITLENDCFSITTYPGMGYSQRTGLYAGIMPVIKVKNKQTAENGASTTITPGFFMSNSGMIDVGVDMVAYKKREWLYQFEVKYQKLMDTYYLMGNSSGKSSLTDFDYRYWGGELTLKYHLGKDIYLGGYCDFFSSTMTFESSSYKNLDGEFKDYAIGPLFSYDSRNNVSYTQSGSLLNLTFRYNNSIDGNHEFNLLQLDARHFIDLKGKSRVLAFQVFAEQNFGNVPFYKMSYLGGKERVRGIPHKNIYLDEGVWYAQSEFRSYIWWRLGAVVYAGAGNIFGKYSNKQLFEGVHWFSGGGVRFMVLDDDKLNFRLDYGKASSGYNSFFFTIREAF